MALPGRYLRLSTERIEGYRNFINKLWNASRFALMNLQDFDADGLEEDPELRAIAEFAAKLCDVPIAQVTVVEEARQRFLAGQGLDTKETPREVSFCQHAMVAGDLMEVRDATADPRFTNNALVSDPPQIRFYAGQPLVSDEGAPLGALCVIDNSRQTGYG